MNDRTLIDKITRAVALDREIRDLANDLKELKRIITAEARNREDEQIPTIGGGAAWEMEGDDGCVARVQFPAPTLKSEISGEGKTIEEIRTKTGRHFTALFVQVPAYKPVQGFRERARELLGRSARGLISKCESKSAPRVVFETKKSEVST